MTGPPMLVAVDVGNTAIKLAVANTQDIQSHSRPLSHKDPIRFQSFTLGDLNWEQQVCDWVKDQTGPTLPHWVVSSVNQSASRPLRQRVSQQFSHADFTEHWQPTCRTDVPIEVAVDFPDRVGIDRLISAYAASIRFASPLIVVDAGSAVTVDLVKPSASQRSIFAGGAIFPGLRLQHAALATGTEGLQNLTETGLQTAGLNHLEPAANTEQAIRVGVIAALAGGIERLTRDYRSALQSSSESEKNSPPKVPPLVVTGGDGPAISAYLGLKHDLIPDLVCLGLLDLAGRRCQIAPSGLK